MRWIKLVFKGLGVVLGLLVLVGLGYYVSNPTYWNRVFSAPIGKVWEVDWYRPLEEVPSVERDDIPTASPEAIAPEALAAAQAYADETESVALLVWHDGALRYEKYGAGFDRNTPTDPLSQHKTVVGLLVGAAIADGYIQSIDQPAADFLPEWTDEARRRIRIRDLLQMSSGLELISGLNPFARSSIRLTLTTDLASSVLELPAVEPPQTRFQYSNVNSQLLGMIVSRAAGRRYADYLSERLWSKLGAAPASVQLDHEGGTARTFCCLITNARSLLRLGLLILDEGRAGGEQVIPAEWIAAMTTPSPRNPNYGLQLWLGSPPGRERMYTGPNAYHAFHSEPFAASDMIYLDGFGGQRVYIVPSRRLVVVRTGRSALDWDDARLPNAILRGMRS
jgi:CubicO group peptidase (beta-lactamase class C family)